MDDIKKTLTLVFTVIGILIFYSVIMAKVEVMSREAEAKLKKVEADVVWHGFLYKKAIEETIRAQKRRNLEEE